MTNEITIRKSGNLIDISKDGLTPLEDKTKKLLEPFLKYTKKKLLYGWARYNSATGQRDRRIEETDKQCFKYDAYGRLVTNFGFSSKLISVLHENGYTVNVENKDPDLIRPDCYDYDLDLVIKHFQFRAKQEECLQAIFNNPCGVTDATTGFGKLCLITMLCLAYPKAKIDIVIRRSLLVKKTHSYLTRYLPNVGLVMAGSKSKGRVTVYTAKSLHHSEFDADIVLADEVHELLADNSSAELATYKNARMFGFTASPCGRIDGTDIRLEALFGQFIFRLPYPEALEHGLVVPIQVQWSNCIFNTNPCVGLDDVQKKRAGIWCNNDRNLVIANKAKTFKDDEQVLITVDTIEHAVSLWQYLKSDGYVLVYDTIDKKDLDWYKNQELLPQDYQTLTPKLKEQYRIDFESGKLKKSISTVFDVGVDSVGLTALIRAEGSDSSIQDIQIPGRVSRIGTKSKGIICDFLDQFDSSMNRRAKNRLKRYKQVEWENVLSLDDGTFREIK